MELTRDVAHTSSPLRQLLAFYVLTVALAVALVVGLPEAGQLTVVLTQFCPTVSVAILTFTLFRRGTRRRLWRSIGLGRVGLRSWGWAIGLPVLLSGGVVGILVLIGSSQLRVLPMTGSAVVSFATGAVVVLLVALVITVGEEIGWRGFMLPRVQQLTGKRRAAVLTGFLHGCFHLPLILIASTYQVEGSRWIVAPLQVLMIAATGVLYAWLRDRSGSVWPAVIAHALINTTLVWGLAMVVATTSTSLSAVAGPTGVILCASSGVLALVLLRTAKVWKAASVAVPRVADTARERVEA